MIRLTEFPLANFVTPSSYLCFREFRKQKVSECWFTYCTNGPNAKLYMTVLYYDNILGLMSVAISVFRWPCKCSKCTRFSAFFSLHKDNNFVVVAQQDDVFSTHNGAQIFPISTPDCFNLTLATCYTADCCACWCTSRVRPLQDQRQPVWLSPPV